MQDNWNSALTVLGILYTMGVAFESGYYITKIARLRRIYTGVKVRPFFVAAGIFLWPLVVVYRVITWEV